jgi:hypothetical protein
MGRKGSFRIKMKVFHLVFPDILLWKMCKTQKIEGFGIHSLLEKICWELFISLSQLNMRDVSLCIHEMVFQKISKPKL